MGYSFTIGNGNVSSNGDITVDFVIHDNAPAFSEPTDYTNQRWPSYGSWINFAQNTGLYEFFYTPNGHLKMGHPGYQKISQSDVDFIRNRFNICCNMVDIDIYDLNRLKWLDYWMKWAINNCPNPVIKNT